MRFENFGWRVAMGAGLMAGWLGLAACNKPASNAPTVTPSPAPAATSEIATTPAPASTVVTPASPATLATPGTLATPSQPVIPGPTPIALQGKDYDLTMLDTPKLKLSKVLNQKKIVVINFWATWCGPCRKEIPDLIALSNEYAGKEVEILGLSVEDPAQATTLVKEYVKQSQINYKVGFSPMPMFLAFNGVRPGAPIPQTFIFGKDGKLRYHIPGMRPAFKDYVAQAIDLALKS